MKVYVVEDYTEWSSATRLGIYKYAAQAAAMVVQTAQKESMPYDHFSVEWKDGLPSAHRKDRHITIAEEDVLE